MAQLVQVTLLAPEDAIAGILADQRKGRVIYAPGSGGPFRRTRYDAELTSMATGKSRSTSDT